jgi:hypothetical protein
MLGLCVLVLGANALVICGEWVWGCKQSIQARLKLVVCLLLPYTIELLNVYDFSAFVV